MHVQCRFTAGASFYFLNCQFKSFLALSFQENFEPVLRKIVLGIKQLKMLSDDGVSYNFWKTNSLGPNLDLDSNCFDTLIVFFLK